MKIGLIKKGIRPKTLIAAIVPPLVSFTYLQDYSFSVIILFLCCLFFALNIQVATNFYNDAIDFLKGADEKRVGPERIAQHDQVPAKEVFLIGHIFLVIAVLFGVPLLIQGGIVILLLGCLSLFFAYGYTGGPFPLAYLGLGELFVFIFFGLVATLGTGYILAGSISLDLIIMSCQLGLLSSVLIGINNFRDRETDLEVGKRTLATRLSRDQYLLLIDLFLFIPYLLILYLIIFIDLKYFIVLFSIGIAYQIKKSIFEIENPAELNQVLALSGKHLAFFSLLLCVGNLCR